MKTLSFFLLMIAGTHAFVQNNPIKTKWSVSDGSIKLFTLGGYSYQYTKVGDPSVTGTATVNSGLNTIALPIAGDYILDITPSGTLNLSLDTPH